MKVLIAGATGAIGRPLISALIAAGHDAVGMTSSAHGLETLKKNGADGVVADALDAQAVDAAVKKVRPGAVIDELTSLPKRYTPDEMRAAADRDRRVRLEGGRNVQNARRPPVRVGTLCSLPGSSMRPVQGSRRKQTRWR